MLISQLDIQSIQFKLFTVSMAPWCVEFCPFVYNYGYIKRKYVILPTYTYKFMSLNFKQCSENITCVISIFCEIVSCLLGIGQFAKQAKKIVSFISTYFNNDFMHTRIDRSGANCFYPVCLTVVTFNLRYSYLLNR